MVWDQLGFDPDWDRKTSDKLFQFEIRELQLHTLKKRLAALPVDKKYRFGTWVLRHPWSEEDDLVRIDFCARCQCELHVDHLCVEPLCPTCAVVDRGLHGQFGSGDPPQYHDRPRRDAITSSEIRYHGSRFYSGEW